MRSCLKDLPRHAASGATRRIIEPVGRRNGSVSWRLARDGDWSCRGRARARCDGPLTVEGRGMDAVRAALDALWAAVDAVPQDTLLVDSISRTRTEPGTTSSRVSAATLRPLMISAAARARRTPSRRHRSAESRLTISRSHASGSSYPRRRRHRCQQPCRSSCKD